MFGRLFAWLANDVIVHTLSNNKSFQQFVLRFDNSLNAHKKKITEEYVNVGEKIVRENITKAKQNMPPASSIGKFATTFVKEVQKEMGKSGKSISSK